MFDTTPNKITVARIVLVPVFMLLLYLGQMTAAFVLYVIACSTDWVDGYIARKYDQVSTFGKFADPLADKILVLSLMCFFIEAGQMPGWAVALVLFREFAVSGLRLVAASDGKVIAAAMSGKVKTFATMIALGAMMILGQYAPVNIIGTAVIVLTTLYSGGEYFYVNRAVFKS